jgi:hypothetical protein
MTKRFLTFLVGLAGLLLGILPAQAALVMPSFDGAPAGWVTDRYDPDSFSDIGPFQSRSDVLAIGISKADGLDTRPAAYQSTFYNTQGMQHAISDGAGSVLSAALWIPEEWGDADNGHVRTDMWGVMTDGTGVSDYPIIGFTNYGDGGARLRIWEGSAWVDLGVAIDYDAWTDLSISFTGSAYEYRVNGVVKYMDNTIDGSTGFSATIMQAYNFCGDTSIVGANCQDYTAHWSNTVTSSVPTPASLPLAALALFALGGTARRSGRRSSK